VLAGVFVLFGVPANAATILYGVVSATQQLITIDTSTGAGTAVGSIGIVGVQGLAYDSSTDTLYGAGTASPNPLITINTATGAGTVIGTGLGLFCCDGVTGLAYDSLGDTLYGVDNLRDHFVSIGRTSGLGSVIHELDTQGPLSLTYDSLRDTLFAVSDNTDELLTISKTGVESIIASIGLSNVRGLAYDPFTDTLFAVNTISTDNLLTINRITGAVTDLGEIGFSDVTGLTFVQVVPVPASAWLLGSALGLLGWMRRRKSA
jgi:uncharacterized protein YjiK